MTEYYIVWQFILIRCTLVRKFFVEGHPNVPDDRYDAFCKEMSLKRTKHLHHFLIPVGRTKGPVNALIAEDGQLPVLMGHIEEYAVAMFRTLHLQVEEHFPGAIHRVHILAFAFYEDPDLAAGALLFLTNGRHDGLLLRFGKEGI